MDFHKAGPAILSLARQEEIDQLRPINYTKAKEAVGMLNAINHKVRRDMLQIIKEQKAIMVTDLFVALRLQQGVASRHLGVLKNAGLLISNRKGKNIFYSINAARINSINSCLDSLTDKGAQETPNEPGIS